MCAARAGDFAMIEVGLEYFQIDWNRFAIQSA
jgi:hypothetical protein